MQNKLYFLIIIRFLRIRYLFFSIWRVIAGLIMGFFFLFFLKNQHLTISLIQLEVLGLSSLLLIVLTILIREKEIINLFVVIVVIVIEASIGLRLIVKQARNINKEFFKFIF